MSVLLELLVSVAGVTGTLLVVTTLFVVGPGRLSAVRADIGTRLLQSIPYLGLLGSVLAVNSLVRELGMDLSWIVGWNITHTIYAIEGTVVPMLQSLAHPWLTMYFSLTYIYGYVFLLVFPIVAYFVLEDLDWLRTAAIAYALNYTIGLGCYLVFIAYGPRNLLPDLVEPLLYTNWPTSQLLVSEVNTNMNVFPSLHTSLAVTVMLLAYRTRHAYPRWLPVAALVGTSVVISTMYLGIHWATDVFFGTVLGVGCVLMAERVVETGLFKRWWASASGRARETARKLLDGA